MLMLSVNSIFGWSFNDSFEFQGHSKSRSRQRSSHDRSSRDGNMKERRGSQRIQARKQTRSGQSQGTENSQ